MGTGHNDFTTLVFTPFHVGGVMRLRLFSFHVAALLSLLIFAFAAHAQTTCYNWIDNYGYGCGPGTSASVAACAAPQYAPAAGTIGAGTVTGLSCADPPTTPSSCIVSGVQTDSVGGATYPFSFTLITTVVTCPTSSCSANSGKHYGMDMSQLGSSAQSAGASICGSDGCNYTVLSSTQRTIIANMGGGSTGVLQDVSAAGTSCSTGGAQATPGQQVLPGQASTTCDTSNGNTACSTQTATGQNCGTFNGDQICLGTVPNGQCAQYASGGVMCVQSAGTAPTTPPVPNNGSSSTTPANPTETVTAGGSTTTATYYTAGQVTGSTKGSTVTGTAPTGTVTGGQATGAAPGSNAANGDCGAPGVTCSGTAPTVPTPGCTDWTACMGTFWTSIQSAPIVAGVTALESAWPSGSCPSETLTLAMFPGKTFDYGTTFCTVWDTYVAPNMSTIMLVVWSLVGVFIVLSA